MIGSLVVCLPVSFKGGNLLIRHHGQEVEFDWAADSGQAIQWAAFYSDCEHEIKHITEGHRVTITYNLCVTEPVGSVLLENPIVQPSTFPLYSYLRGLMQDPVFLKDGKYNIIKLWVMHIYIDWYRRDSGNLLLSCLCAYIEYCRQATTAGSERFRYGLVLGIQVPGHKGLCPTYLEVG